MLLFGAILFDALSVDSRRHYVVTTVSLGQLSKNECVCQTGTEPIEKVR